MTDLARFRFDAETHTYLDLSTGEELPHITGMLEATGWIDDTWYTEESCDRGRAVHKLTADYDLGALDLAQCVSSFRGYLLGHVRAMEILRPTIHGVEQAIVHPRLHFGGRPDRDVTIAAARATLEIKSGVLTKAHQIQTALQAILIAQPLTVPPELVLRFCLYLNDRARFRLEQHKDRRDFDEARRIIRVCTGRRNGGRQ